MEIVDCKRAKKFREIHTPEVSLQTGFPSPATHYLEPRINLHHELVTNCDATYFIRIDGNGYKDYNILDGDVLIVDKSLEPKDESLLIAVVDDEFCVLRKSELKTECESSIWGVVTYIIHQAI